MTHKRAAVQYSEKEKTIVTAGGNARITVPPIARRRARRCPSALAVATQPIRRRVAAREPCGAMEEVCARFVSQKISQAPGTTR